jgi:hypothetical protein
MVKILLNLVIIILIVFLLFLTTQPLNIYEQIGNVSLENINENTNLYLNQSQQQKKYLLSDSDQLIYKSLGIVNYDVNTNNISLLFTKEKYSFDLDKDKDKFILSLLSADK